MPQPGEVRHGASESVQWDGSRWQPIGPAAALPSTDHPSVDMLGIPGLEEIANLPSNLVKGVQAAPDVARNLFSHPGATLKGFVQGASEAATPGRTGLLALLTGGATLPATLAAAGGQATAEAGRVLTHTSNAPQSFPDAALEVAGAAAMPGLAGAEGALAAKAGGQAKLVKGAIGAGLGGYEGYKYGGIPGMVAGAAGGAAVGGGKVRLPGRLGALSDLLSPAEAETPSRIGLQNAVTPEPPVTPGPSQVGRWDASRVTPLSGGQVPSASVDDVLNDLGGRAADTKAGFSPEMVAKLNGIKQAAQPDLYDLATAPTPPAGFDWPEAGGRMEPDAMGSHKLVADDPAAQLAAKLGTPSDAEVAERTASRNRTGSWGGQDLADSTQGLHNATDSPLSDLAIQRTGLDPADFIGSRTNQNVSPTRYEELRRIFGGTR